MSQDLFIEENEQFLLIVGKGTRNDFESIITGTQSINDAIVEHNAKYVVLDYREVHYNVPMAQAFNLVKVLEHKLPAFKHVTMATVTNVDNLEIAQFWESISSRRSFNFKVFTRMAEAQEWLIGEMELSKF